MIRSRKKKKKKKKKKREKWSRSIVIEEKIIIVIVNLEYRTTRFFEVVFLSFFFFFLSQLLSTRIESKEWRNRVYIYIYMDRNRRKIIIVISWRWKMEQRKVVVLRGRRKIFSLSTFIEPKERWRIVLRADRHARDRLLINIGATNDSFHSSMARPTLIEKIPRTNTTYNRAPVELRSRERYTRLVSQSRRFCAVAVLLFPPSIFGNAAPSISEEKKYDTRVYTREIWRLYGHSYFFHEYSFSFSLSLSK